MRERRPARLLFARKRRDGAPAGEGDTSPPSQDTPRKPRPSAAPPRVAPAPRGCRLERAIRPQGRSSRASLSPWERVGGPARTSRDVAISIGPRSCFRSPASHRLIPGRLPCSDYLPPCANRVIGARQRPRLLIFGERPSPEGQPARGPQINRWPQPGVPWLLPPECRSVVYGHLLSAQAKRCPSHLLPADRPQAGPRLKLSARSPAPIRSEPPVRLTSRCTPGLGTAA